MTSRMESTLGLIMAAASPCTRRAATSGAGPGAARDRGKHEQQQANGQKAAPSDVVADAPSWITAVFAAE